jgi:hypothetical protein
MADHYRQPAEPSCGEDNARPKPQADGVDSLP